MQPKNGSTTQETSVKTVKVFVEVDAEGDKEIYLDRSGVTEQVTNNWYEDDKPSYDEISGIVVWQSLIQDRYQIMSYNTVTGELRQITGTSYNNTNPHVYGNTVVWQGWIENNWEILFTDLTLAEREIVQVTNNIWDDMFPQIHERLITWQAFIDDVWQVFVYDIVNKSTMRVGESDGRYENPRFMLVIDNKKENGDVATVGYDTVTGEITPFGVTPAPLMPQNVPESPAQDQNKAVFVETNQVNYKTQREAESSGSDGDGDNDENDNTEGTVPIATSTTAVGSDDQNATVQGTTTPLVVGPSNSSHQTSSTSVATVSSSTSSHLDLNINNTASSTFDQNNPSTASSATTTDSGQVILQKPATTTSPVIEPVVLNSSTGSSEAAE